MSASLNKTILIGNVGQDIELKQTGSGNSVAEMSIATSYKPKDGEEKTEWHRVTVWGKTAENCAKYLGKGSSVFVEGRLETQKYEKDGETRYTTKIIAEDVKFLGGKPAGESASAPPATTQKRQARGSRGQSRQEQLPAYDSDMPF